MLDPVIVYTIVIAALGLLLLAKTIGCTKGLAMLAG